MSLRADRESKTRIGIPPVIDRLLPHAAKLARSGAKTVREKEPPTDLSGDSLTRLLPRSRIETRLASVVER